VAWDLTRNRYRRIELLAYIFYGLFILACVVLVLTILLQPGKADAGALFSSSVSSTAFGPRGTQTLLAKITIGAAAAFMLLGLCLSLPFINGTSSVLQSVVPETPQATATPTPLATPAAPAAVPTSTTVTATPSPTPKK
jgi:preprotein translocase subunit SecG